MEKIVNSKINPTKNGFPNPWAKNLRNPKPSLKKVESPQQLISVLKNPNL